LDRFVALKTLPVERLSDPERKRRFAQEAKAASALNHPNIVHIYDVTETDGIQYISMEYVPGKTLDQLIGPQGLVGGSSDMDGNDTLTAYFRSGSRNSLV
jgi:serine/threonine protein kinase